MATAGVDDAQLARRVDRITRAVITSTACAKVVKGGRRF